MLAVILNQHLIKKERTGRMQKPRIPPHPTTKTRNIVFSSDGVSCAEKDEYDTAFAEYRYNKNQKIKEYLKKNSKEIIQWLIDLSDEKRLIYFLQSGLVDKNDVGQIVDEILNSNLENKSVIAAYALNGQKTEQKEENIVFAL